MEFKKIPIMTLAISALLLAMPVTATPHGTQVIIDAAGDAVSPSGLADEDHQDIIGLYVDSDGAAVDFTFEYVDFYNHDPLFETSSEVQFVVTNGVNTHEISLICNYGYMYPFALAATNYFKGNVCSTYLVATTNLILIGVGDPNAQGNYFQPQIDYAGNTVTVSVPYSTLGAVSGSTFSDWAGESREGISSVTSNEVDRVSGSVIYALT
jgi:hypothetical protein